ncbi:glycosyltransferase family 4 protein [Bosea sp. (in: a-proteobacteria)]|uniref:glycosyltransferase family 4 protein n=1 Tax=Bosea sp. (in: a-proteobacteria) TaxID=1871050 RepID=UPI00260FE9E5|nr:glycosyltransferase family 4 protein [Bosea sp. (in: a-proteobacteria)]MCO5091023.1 glycosyltransferase family 4 protein [Bosea sp. (in: a-proteobacteria)]
MHILFLTDNFPPEVNAPASRTFEHCREWVKAGHRVTVITCAPNFPKGKVFDGYRNRLFARETIEGIEVVRVWSYITANEGFLRRTLDYVSFMVAAVPASFRVDRPDVVVATSPQFFTACAGWLVGALRRRPFVFELRDLWPESIRAVGAMKASALLDALERLELFLYRRATAIVSVTHAFRDNLIARGIDGAKIHVVTNGADLDRFQPRDKDAALMSTLGLQGKFIAGYIGTHGLAHALETLLEAAGLLQEQGRDDIHMLFLGDGARKAELVERAQRSGLRNVTFLDTVPKEDVVRYWSILDASVIHLRRSALFETVIPSKLFETMAMGVPVLHGVKGESARIVEAEKAGLTFEPENAAALSDRLVQLADDRSATAGFSANGRSGAQNYDRRHLAARMLDLLAACRRPKTAGAIERPVASG